ncbi:MAG TPA: hypothetical protein VL485_21370 [Ktedonobacteraceae bacterium]|nr:hypothetical protein [Ktedonobacteraceae bacterium]
MAIIVLHHNTTYPSIQKRFGDVPVLDVTSKGPEPWVRFSPFYPHGDIPVPFSPDYVSASVEGIWQGLKVFVQADVDTGKFTKTRMKGLKRSARTFGQVLGHRQGVHGEALLPYLEARYALYLPSYLWVLEHCLQQEITELRRLATEQTVIVLDYETNSDVNDTSSPLSHASLIKCYIEGAWPSR